MECKNHPGIAAAGQCATCGQSFCSNCLVPIDGRFYCATCKTAAVADRPVAMEEATVPCREAKDALTYALIGIVCFGIILEPIALSLAIKARRILAANPRYSGSGNANAALVISIVMLTIWVLAVFARLMGALNGKL